LYLSLGCGPTRANCHHPAHAPRAAGKWLEARAKAQTSDVVTSLLSLRAKTAVLLKLKPGGAGAAGAPAGPPPAEHHVTDDIIGEEEIPAELVQVRVRGKRWDAAGAHHQRRGSREGPCRPFRCPPPRLRPQIGDTLRVLPGATLPADGVVVAGRSAVDESMVTGESVPVPKHHGDDVIGGARPGGLLRRAPGLLRRACALQRV
jgi:hypothetical protein